MIMKTIVLDELELYTLQRLVQVFLDRNGEAMVKEIPAGFQALARAEYKLRSAAKQTAK
jgi:hypothetical protein